MAVEPVSARCAVEVMAGFIPGVPDDQYTKRYVITSADWAVDEEARAVLLAETNGKGLGYASWLMLQPDRLNWVRVDWVWF